MPAEATQEQGRKGVALVKRWLEATTFIELPWNAYENPPMCQVEHLGGVKEFDLNGFFLTGDRQPVSIENKSYTVEGGQYRKFQEFLATAYSATAKVREKLADPGREFIYVTSHPFGPLARWSKLESSGEIKEALTRCPQFLNGTTVDEDLARIVADRVWVLVINKKQERLSLSPKELGMVQAALSRKESTL